MQNGGAVLVLIIYLNCSIYLGSLKAWKTRNPALTPRASINFRNRVLQERQVPRRFLPSVKFFSLFFSFFSFSCTSSVKTFRLEIGKRLPRNRFGESVNEWRNFDFRSVSVWLHLDGNLFQASLWPGIRVAMIFRRYFLSKHRRSEIRVQKSSFRRSYRT